MTSENALVYPYLFYIWKLNRALLMNGNWLVHWEPDSFSYYKNIIFITE